MNYHNRPEISRGMLATFNESPRLYQALYIDKSMVNELSSDALVIGSLTHQQLLEPHITDNIVVIPQDVLTTNGQRRGNKWEEFEKQHEGKLILRREDHETCMRAVQSVRSSIGKLIDHPKALREHEIYWTDETGLEMRAKLDLVVPTPRGLYVIDVKTCADLAKFKYQVSDGLWLQYEHYTAGVKQAFNVEECTFFFCVVEKSGVFRVRNYTLDADSIWNADVRYRELVNKLSEAYRSNDWSEPGEGEIIELRCCYAN